MQTHCSCDQLEFEGFDGHKVVAGFDGGAIASDGGALLLRHGDKPPPVPAGGRRFDGGAIWIARA